MAVLATQSYEYLGLSVTYKERSARQDRHHLIVVFSGFRPPGSPYDFDGSVADTLRSHMLWIRDDFDGEMCYYIRNRSGFVVSDAVNSLIESKRKELGLRKDQCTFMGFSKGGSAALFHGLAFDYPNILVTAPRIFLGSGNVHDRPAIINAMTESGSPEEIAELDEVIPNLIRGARNESRNLYLFSSLEDHFHETETGPMLEHFRAFSNFNYFETDSDLVRKHKDVTLYNMPLVIAILAALGEGTIPVFGEAPNGGRVSSGTSTGSLAEIQERGNLVTEVRTLSVVGSDLMIGGVAFREGYPAPSPHHIRTELVLKSREARHSFQLQQTMDDRISNRYYRNEFCNYSFGSFKTAAGTIDLASLPFGRYELQLKVRQAKVNMPLVPVRWTGSGTSSMSGDSLFQLRSTPAGSVLVKRPLVSVSPAQCSFSVDEGQLKDGIFHVSGSFLVAGYEASSYQDVNFYAVFVPRTLAENVGVALYSTRKHVDGLAVDDPWGVYTHSHFSTRRHAGFQLPNLTPDWYDVVITADFSAGGVFSCNAGVSVFVDATGNASLSTDGGSPIVGSFAENRSNLEGNTGYPL